MKHPVWTASVSAAVGALSTWLFVEVCLHRFACHTWIAESLGGFFAGLTMRLLVIALAILMLASSVTFLFALFGGRR